MGRRKDEKPFSKDVAAVSEERARDIVLSDLGSKHRTKRRDITITSVQQIKSEDVKDVAVKQKIEGA